MNPVPIMKLVEIIRGYNTSDAVTKTIMDLSVALGKVPVEVNDYPGFVANRILMPMINESIETLYNGVAGVYEIDTVMKLGMAHPMGPLQLADFIGLDVCLAILNVMYDGFKNPKYAPCPLLVNMVRAGKLGVKSGEGFYDYSESKKAEKVAKIVPQKLTSQFIAKIINYHPRHSRIVWSIAEQIINYQLSIINYQLKNGDNSSFSGGPTNTRQSVPGDLSLLR